MCPPITDLFHSGQQLGDLVHNGAGPHVIIGEDGDNVPLVQVDIEVRIYAVKAPAVADHFSVRTFLNAKPIAIIRAGVIFPHERKRFWLDKLTRLERPCELEQVSDCGEPAPRLTTVYEKRDNPAVGIVPYVYYGGIISHKSLFVKGYVTFK